MTDRPTRREIIRAGGASAAGIALLGAGCDSSSKPAATAAAKPRPIKRATAPPGALNVVVFICDSMRVDHAYGPRARMETLDRLATQGLRFTRVRPEAMPTIPARRSIMTGHRIFPFRHWHPYEGLPPQPGWEPVGHERQMWTQVLQREGWTTGYVTDNPHLLAKVHDRFRAKFDRAEVVVGQVPLRRKPTRPVSQDELYKHLPPVLRGSRAEPRMKAYLSANPRGRDEQDFLAPRVHRKAMDWLDWAKTRQPFALVVDNFDAHEPWDAPPNLIDIYDTPTTPGVEPIQPFPTPAAQWRKEGLSPALVRRMSHLYAAEMTMVDRWVGHTLAKLENLGLADKTVVVLISDHGVLLGEYGWVGKRYTELHHELTHVPFLIRHPEGKAKGVSSRYFASTHDVGPTVLSMLGFDRPHSMNGADVSVLLDGKKPPARRYYVSAYTDHVMAGDGRWHLIANNQGGEKRLYDLKRDPHERHNVAARYPQHANRLWRAIVRQAGGPLPKFKISSPG
ncbi:MAG TPA: sulfatase [Thermoleophilaceae bacterium]